MKLKKPTVTENQTELEIYVASLLHDQSVENTSVKDFSTVTKLADEKFHLKEIITEYTSEPSVSNKIEEDDKSISQKSTTVSDVIPLNNNFTNTEKRDDSEEELDESPRKKIKPQPLENDVLERNNKANIENKKSAESASEKIPESKTAIEQNNSLQEIEEKNSIERAQAKEERIASEEKLAKETIQLNASLKESAAQENKASDRETEHHQKVNQEVAEYKEKDFQEKTTDPRLQGVEKLLSKIALANVVAPVISKKEGTSTNDKTQIKNKGQTQAQQSSDVSLENAQSSFAHRENKSLKSILGNVFQTLVFEVNRLPLAVPLVKLGGIVNISKLDVTPLVGTPDWFMGLVPNERGNLMVVDTQKFLMPEQKAQPDREYQYLIILDDSQWALACHGVGDAKNLTPDDIRWSARSSKRPWFAGMVVEYMSALVEVDELINMLAENITD